MASPSDPRDALETPDALDPRALAPSTLPELFGPLRRRRPWWQRAPLFGLATMLFGLGAAGWILPVVAGWPFFVLAIFVLASVSGRVRSWVDRHEQRLPHAHRLRLRWLLARARAWVDRGRSARPGRAG
jgi:hypothetical protein